MSASYNISVNTTTNTTMHNLECHEQLQFRVVATVITSVTLLFGTPACVAVLWHLFQKLRRGVPATPNDVFMLNLTVMDLVGMGLSPAMTFILWYNMAFEIVSSFFISFTMTGQPLFMTCICLDCYLAVVHPITYRARKGLSSRVTMSVGVWVITLVYGALYGAFYSVMITHAVSMLPYVVAILTIGICDFFILRALKSSDPGGRDLHPQKKKALQIIVNSLVMTVVFYIPPFLMFIFLKSISMRVELDCVLYVLSQAFAIAGTAVVPILYLNNLGKLDCIWRWCRKTT